MRYIWIVFVWINLLSLHPALAQLYRWTDATGKVHITDDPATIPPAYRDRARSSTTDQATPDGQSDATPPPPAAPRDSGSPARTAPPSPTPAPQVSPPKAGQRVHELAQEIAIARQERQTYLDRLRSTRTIYTTPEFVRQRRQIAELGRALVAVEQRLDTLVAELERLQPRFPTQVSSLAVQRTQQAGFDAAGHDATYWQKRARAIRTQLDNAQSQRRAVLSQLTAITNSETNPAERQGRGLLQHAATLQQIEAEIDTAGKAWQALLQEASQTAIPPDWLH